MSASELPVTSRDGLLVDTNLLVLWLIGETAIDAVGRTRRVREFDARAFGLVDAAVRRAREVVVTPHVLSESSNLLGQVGGTRGLPASARRLLVESGRVWRESHVRLREAMVDVGLVQAFGLTDWALLRLSRRYVLLTDDVGLVKASLRTGGRAINFRCYWIGGVL